jgi:glycosyltransferase involved in cell wall biosynthesis
MISICIPTYNQTIYLEKLMRSIVEQDYQDFEVVVADDSTTEDVFNLIENFKEKLPGKIRYCRNSPPLGSPENWNYAISMAKYNIIKIMHHDDYFTYSDSLKKFVEHFVGKSKELRIVFSGGYTKLKNRNENYTVSQLSGIKLLNKPLLLLKGNHFGSPSSTCFIKTDIKFDKRLKWLVDIYFYLLYLKKAKHKIYISEPLITSVQDNHNLTLQLHTDYYNSLRELNIIVKDVLPNIFKQLLFLPIILKQTRLAGIYEFRKLKTIEKEGPKMCYVFFVSVVLLKISYSLFKR